MTVAVAPNPNHPAPFSPEVLAAFQHRIDIEYTRLRRKPVVLDPFAGVGRIHDLTRCETVGVELEPEWAACRSKTLVGDATALSAIFAVWQPFDVIATSPCYGNRMADHHDAADPSDRRGYRFSLGRMPSEGSAAVMHWGPDYRNLHRAALVEMAAVLADGGLLMVNMSDHIRKGEVVHVVEWWRHAIEDVGFRRVSVEPVGTRRMRFGANREARVDGERIITARKPA